MILLIVVIKNVLHYLQELIILRIIYNWLTYKIGGRCVSDIFRHIIYQLIVWSCAVFLYFIQYLMLSDVIILQNLILRSNRVLIYNFSDILFCQAVNGSPVHINNWHNCHLLQSQASFVQDSEFFRFLCNGTTSLQRIWSIIVSSHREVFHLFKQQLMSFVKLDIVIFNIRL